MREIQATCVGWPANPVGTQGIRCYASVVSVLWVCRQRAVKPARAGRQQRWRKAGVAGPFLFVSRPHLPGQTDDG